MVVSIELTSDQLLDIFTFAFMLGTLRGLGYILDTPTPSETIMDILRSMDRGYEAIAVTGNYNEVDEGSKILIGEAFHKLTKILADLHGQTWGN